MKTRLYSLFAGLLFSATAAVACNDSTGFTINTSQDGFHYWEGLDIGVNGYFNTRNNLETPAGYSFLELDYARSHSFAWNIAQYNVHLYKNYINLVTGIGIEWNSYALRNNVSLIPDTNVVAGVLEPGDFSKNKFKTTWLNAPLMLEFNTSKNADRSFHVGAGVTFGYNIFRNRLKQEYEINGNVQKRKTKDDFNVEPFRYSATVRVGYGDFTLFANYGLSELFKSGRGPEVHPFSAGVSVSF